MGVWSGGHPAWAPVLALPRLAGDTLAVRDVGGKAPLTTEHSTKVRGEWPAPACSRGLRLLPRGRAGRGLSQEGQLSPKLSGSLGIGQNLEESGGPPRSSP